MNTSKVEVTNNRIPQQMSLIWQKFKSSTMGMAVTILNSGLGLSVQ
jgi:hypothetical protein